MLDRSITELNRDIADLEKQDDQAIRLLQIRGVGQMVASSDGAIVGRGTWHRNGRHFAAKIGLVPREHPSTG